MVIGPGHSRLGNPRRALRRGCPSTGSCFAETGAAFATGFAAGVSSYVGQGANGTRRHLQRGALPLPQPSLAALAATNLAYHVLRKPTEIFVFLSGALNKAPAETRREYGRYGLFLCRPHNPA
jgi:hypothetical protein